MFQQRSQFFNIYKTFSMSHFLSIFPLVVNGRQNCFLLIKVFLGTKPVCPLALTL